MPNSLRNKIKHFCYKGYLSESERDRLINALDNSELNRVKTELDCISREDAIELIACADETNGNEPVFNGKQVIKMLKGLPPVTPKPKTGHWEDCSNGWMCSNCYKDVSHESDFCPHCGAKMAESENEQ